MVSLQGISSVDGLSINPRGQLTEKLGCIRWIDGCPQVQVVDSLQRSAILRFLAIAATGHDFIIRREPSDSNHILLRAETLPVGSPAFLTRQALSLTFHPLNHHGYIFTPASCGELCTDGSEPEAHHFVDLFQMASSLNLPMVNCPCGTSYPFLSHLCPSCKGGDPLGLLLKNNWQRIERCFQALAVEEVIANSRYKMDLERIRKALCRKEEQCQDFFELHCNNDETGEAFVKQLLRNYQIVFDLSKLEFKSLRESMLGEPKAMSVALIRGSSRIRAVWLGRAEPCWASCEGFTAQLAVKLQEGAANYPTCLSTCVGQFVKAGALLKPVYKNLQRLVKEESLLWRFLKGGWRGFRAVTTVGVSEAVRFGIGMFKEAKMQKVAEQGFEALEEATVLTGRAADGLAEVEREFELLGGQVGANLARHCMCELAYDYCGRSHEQQLDITERIARECSVRMPRILERGKEAKAARMRRRIIFAACLALAVLSGAIAWWILH